MTWNKLNLHGAQSISKLCGVYEIADSNRLPNGTFKIKVLERAGDFIALPNVCVKNERGVAEWIAGIGKSELEALQDAIARLMAELSARACWSEDQLEWSDPRDF